MGGKKIKSTLFQTIMELSLTKKPHAKRASSLHQTQSEAINLPTNQSK